MRHVVLETELLDGSILKTSVDEQPRITTRTSEGIELILDAYDTPDQARAGHSRLLRQWTADLATPRRDLPQPGKFEDDLANGR